MRLLLDTNALLWLLADDDHLSTSTRHAIETASEIAISEVSLWEIAIKISIGKLHPIAKLYETVHELGFRRLNLTDEHLRKYQELPLIHRDPFDRMLVAQAMLEALVLVTSDNVFVGYNIKTLDT